MLCTLLPQAQFSLHFTVERAHRMPSVKGPRDTPSRTFIFRLLNFRDQDLILREARKLGEHPPPHRVLCGLKFLICETVLSYLASSGVHWISPEGRMGGCAAVWWTFVALLVLFDGPVSEFGGGLSLVFFYCSWIPLNDVRGGLGRQGD